MKFLLLALALPFAYSQPRSALPKFSIDLDASPDVRFAEVNQHFNASMHNMFGPIGNSTALRKFFADMSAGRGPENAELQAEIEGVAKITKIPADIIHVMQMAYELTAIYVPPIINLTCIQDAVDPALLAEYGVAVPSEPIVWPWRGPGCTGIIGHNSQDGTVNHVRNLDFFPGPLMQGLVYDGRFMRNGKEVFRAQMMAGYSCIVTGMKMGSNGFSYETNTRFFDHEGELKQFFQHLFKEKRALNGWTVRKMLETAQDYEDAVSTFSTTPMVAAMYGVLSGVKKGTIVSRSADGVAHQMVLGQKGGNFECRDDYIIMTNFDYYWRDVREWFDPTGSLGKGFGKPRRLAAQQVLNASAVLTPDVLFSAINSEGDLSSDTIFQAVMNVEKGVWNVSMPQLPK
mmetsp:Transcript_10355/g.19603  ORF Transcript_10355/g.19603 Transcript_10355/m.19603 type:complete len:401 (-) Transcript_10355:68-1270(-)|eukprot:CAMPEP_0175152612 /NCGR_PEP_ID=MMETSP0087-20121206/19215_1 /TAXON_ID=136419 /ORGANISM="Unknown Unknown, Strain D1" /LENGTH=400 /DNA_ID=CAMNT_0016439073 /DNA_START=22 /DNA_END=1224 /DNA_ORIENTATION=-